MSGQGEWAWCDHEWVELADSMFSNEYHVQVRCLKCACPGEQDVEDGSVTWPAT